MIVLTSLLEQKFHTDFQNDLKKFQRLATAVLWGTSANLPLLLEEVALDR